MVQVARYEMPTAATMPPVAVHGYAKTEDDMETVTMDQLGCSPAPWKVKPWQASDDFGISIEDFDGHCVADVSYCPNARPDSHMLAAAPDMYSALHSIMYWSEQCAMASSDNVDRQLAAQRQLNSAMRRGKAALRRARGQAGDTGREVVGYEVRADKDDDGRTVFDVYELYDGDSEFLSDFFGIEDAKEYIREKGWRGEIKVYEKV